MNGIAQGAASFARAVGPALGGTIWAWSCSNGLSLPFNHVFLFVFVIGVSVLIIVHSWTMLDDSININQSEVNDHSGILE